MSIEIKVPMLPESVADATVLTWHKKAGDSVKRDETLVDLETDKVVLEVPAPQDGILTEIIKAEGMNVVADELLAKIEAGAAAISPAPAEPEQPATNSVTSPVELIATPAPASTPTPAAPAEASPSARRLMGEHEVKIAQVSGSGKGGRISKDDVQQHMTGAPAAQAVTGERPEKRVPMTRLRARIAERLLSAQADTAMLTTFNEVNMQAVMDLRKRYKDDFEKAHGVKLGFMSLFTKATVEALKRSPDVNASVDGKDIIYHGYYDIGIAVSTPRGLVVPILRDADQMSLADIELAINDCAQRAQQGKLSLEEMTGGTFTISNGGVFGSLLSTPILNPPQSGILGMHKIEQRAVVENGEVVARPMMYLAMSYDHRIVDGKESVSFLVTIKNLLEDPSRLLLDI